MPWIPLAAAAVGAAGSIGAGAIGASASAAERENANRLIEQTIKDYEAIGVPPEEARRIALQRYQYQGDYTPESDVAVQLGDSNMVGISTDPAVREAQMKALNSLEDIGSNGGMMLSDRAAYENTMGDLAAQERGRREAILQDAQQRGGYGSGTALAAQLMNQQESARRAQQAGLQIQAEAQRRALDALAQGGSMATNMRTQEFGEKAAAAKAQDEIAQWNAQNSQAIRSGNVAGRNTAQQFNLTNRQNLSNSNTDLANKEETYNKGLGRQVFEDQMALTQGKANARANQASNIQKQADSTANMWGGIGSSVAQAAGTVAANYEDPDQKKKTVTTY